MELPQPDVLDRAGRIHRIIIASIVGVIAGAIAFAIATSVAKPDMVPKHGVYTVQSNQRVYGFVYYMTGFAFAAGVGIALALQNYIAKKARRGARIPQVKVR